MQRKSLAISAAFVGLLGLLSGCSGTPATQVAPVETASTFANVTLKVACPDTTAQTLLEQYGPSWSRRTGARVEVMLYSSRAASPPAADVWIFPPSELPQLAPQLSAVPEALQKESKSNWVDIFPLYRKHLLVWDRQTRAVPLLGDAYVCFYRRDLFDDPKHQAAFQKQFNHPLTPPATWEEVLEIATYFNEHWAAPAEGRTSLAALPATPGELDALFFSVAAPYARQGIRTEESAGDDRKHDQFSFHFDHDTGAPRIAQPGFVHALTLLQQLQRFRPAQAAVNPAVDFARGRSVLHFGPVEQLRLFQERQAPIRDKVGICPVPGSRVYFPYAGTMPVPAEKGVNLVPYRGARGLLAAVPSNSAHSAAAWSLLEALASPELSRQIVSDPRWGGCPWRLSHLEERWDGFKLERTQSEQLRAALVQTLQRGTQNPVVQLRTPNAKVYQDALLEQVNQVLLKNEQPKIALERVERAWLEEAKKRGDAHRNDYRLNLGLDGQRP